MEMNAADNVELNIDRIKLQSLEMKTLELSSLLKNRLQYYREENAKFESLFKLLNLLNEDLQLSSCLRDELEKLRHLQEKLEAKKLDTKSLTLSHAERLRKQNNYLSKLKICIKTYVSLNESLSKEIKIVKWELDQSKKKMKGILSVPEEELKAMEMKVKRYENELVKFEKRYPWLKDPEFHLPNISKEMDALNSLREEKEKLTKELSIYKELKPSIKEATVQLAKIKLENQEISDKLLEARK